MDGLTVGRSPLPDDLAVVGQLEDTDRTFDARSFCGRADRIARTAGG